MILLNHSDGRAQTSAVRTRHRSQPKVNPHVVRCPKAGVARCRVRVCTQGIDPGSKAQPDTKLSQGIHADNEEHTTGAHSENGHLPEGPGHSESGHEHGHGHHSGIEAAEHQVAHRAIEKGSFKFLESVAERLTSKQLMQKLGSKVLTNAGERAAERAGERALNKAGMKAAEHAAEKLGERLGERVVERVAERAGERMGERVVERAGERLGERLGERVIERAGERAMERAGERAMERAGERLGERVMERVGERVGENVVAKAGIKAGEHAAERVGEALVERAVERAGTSAIRTSAAAARTQAAAGHTAGASASHAAAAAHGGMGLLDAALDRLLTSRFGRRFLSPAILARVGRGAMVALPAIGALFVAHLAHQDFERMEEEKHAGNLFAMVGFAVAFICDMADVFAHLVVVAGLLHQHFQVGVHIAHSVLHKIESWGLVIAVVSTLAAAAAEVLAMRASSAAKHAAAGALRGAPADGRGRENAPGLVMGGAASAGIAALHAHAQQGHQHGGQEEDGTQLPQPM